MFFLQPFSLYGKARSSSCRLYRVDNCNEMCMLSSLGPKYQASTRFLVPAGSGRRLRLSAATQAGGQTNRANLRTCKQCKQQYDPETNHPRACKYHTAHYGGEFSKIAYSSLWSSFVELCVDSQSKCIPERADEGRLWSSPSPFSSNQTRSSSVSFAFQHALSCSCRAYHLSDACLLHFASNIHPLHRFPYPEKIQDSILAHSLQDCTAGETRRKFEVSSLPLPILFEKDCVSTQALNTFCFLLVSTAIFVALTTAYNLSVSVSR